MKRKLLFAATLLAGVLSGSSAFAQSKGETIEIDGVSYTVESENLIKNGSFEDGLTGWTYDFTNELKSDKFEIKTEGAKDGSNYLLAPNNTGAKGEGSIGTAWDIEKSKTYLFRYFIKYNVGATKDGKDPSYLKTSLTNNKGDETNVLGTPTVSLDGEWCQFQTVFTNEEYTYIQVSFRWLENQWGFDDFALYEVTYNVATAEDYQALNSAISAAETHKLGFEQGEYAPYEHVEVLEALAAAKAIDQEVENAKDLVTKLTQTLTEAKWTANTEEVNGIYDGTFALQDEHTTGPTYLDGWTNTDRIRQLVKNTTTYPGLEYANDNAAVFAWGDTHIKYGEKDGYTLPLNENTIYELTCKVAAWTDGDFPSKGTISFSVANATVYNGSLNHNAFSNVGKLNATDKDPFVVVSFKFTTKEAGNYVIDLYGNQHFVVTDFELKKASITIAEEEKYDNTLAGTATTVALNRTIKAGINTLVLPFALTQDEVEATFGTGSKVYVVKSYADDNITFESQEGIEANVPCLLEAAEAGTAYEFVGVALEAGEPETTEGDVQMIGTYEPKTLTASDENTYVVSDDALYLVGSSVSVKATRAYFVVNGANGVKAISMSFGGEATGITTVVDSEAKTGKVYDLNGREVKTPSRGIYIIDGKKVFLSK